MKLGSIGKYAGTVGDLAAVYQHYSQRGVQGLIEDIKDIPNMLTNQGDIQRLGIGLALRIGGNYLVKKYVPAGVFRYVAVFAVNYMGTNMILDAVQKGSMGSMSGPFSFIVGGQTQAPTAPNSTNQFQGVA